MFRKTVVRTMLAAASTLIGNSILCHSNKKQTYIWGNGYYQARPDALLQFHNFYPKKVKNLPTNLVELFFGEYYEAGIDSSGQLYIWEKHSIDANYNQKNKDQERQGIKIIQKDVKSVRFTSGYIWILDKNNRVYQLPIIKKFDENNNLIDKKLGDRRQVEPLKGTVQLQTGRDHVLSLNEKGQVYAMGDDTLGQCGQADTDRNTCPPYTEKRIKFPTKKNLQQIVQICSGGDHNLAIDRRGNLYGWGSNSNLQLSHQQQFSRMNNPLLCSYNPIKIFKNLDHIKILKIIAGQQFSIIVGENKQNGSHQVYSFGSNLRGQLAINEIKHFNDVAKVQKLSNYVMKVKGQEKKIAIDKIQCGKSHWYIMEWGDNEYGQMGNKKRSPCLSPILLRDFMDKKVTGVFAGENNSGVIVEQQQKSK